MANRTEWAEKAVAGILSAKERESAKRELLDHMEDHMADLMAAGFSKEDAEKHAVFAMGAPEDTAKLLRRAHQPILTRLLQVSWWMLGICLVIFWAAALTLLAPTNMDDLFQEKEPSAAEEMAPWFSPESFDSLYEDWDYLRLVEPGNSLKKGDYTFTVTHAAVNGKTQGDYGRYRYQIVLCLEVTRDSMFTPWPKLPGDWQMATEDGSRSLSYGHDRNTETGLLHGFIQDDRQYFLFARGFFPQDSRWVDLSYRNGESDFTLRVELEGGTKYAR